MSVSLEFTDESNVNIIAKLGYYLQLAIISFILYLFFNNNVLLATTIMFLVMYIVNYIKKM